MSRNDSSVSLNVTGGTPRRVRYVRTIDQIPEIPADQRALLEKVAQRYVFRANDYYLRLIDWSDPDDPIKQLIIPREEELTKFGRLDASDEASFTVTRGVQHKYADTVLLLCNEVCGAYCRYCFRKRLFMDDNEETTHDVSEGLTYIRRHPEVSNVLLTGGDPLIMSSRRLREIIFELARIPHVRLIRIGTKMPAFNPFRVLDDPALHELFRRYSTADCRIFVMAHFDHPRELTEAAVEGITLLTSLGVSTVNQCPVIRGVNDDADVLVEMFETLSNIGCPQYYLFQCRPTAGNEPYEIPIVRSFELFDAARRRVSGLSRRARFVMSHSTGKVEVLGMDEDRIYCRYHRARNPADESRMMVFRRDDEAYWFDQLQPVE
ncbi:MAG: KamA family radical SAM protein [Planctomycetota bacterium]|jgi:KamA family protein